MMNMKRLGALISVVLFSLFTLMAVYSCGNKDKGTREKIIASQEIEIDCVDTIILLQIDKLISAITEVQNTADWLDVVILSYETGAPQVKVVCSANNDDNKRVAVVIVKTKEGDEITLTITQKVNTNFDEVHNTQTDKPALAPCH